MDYRSRLRFNLKLFYFTSFFSYLLFHLSIWVAFQLRIFSFSEMGMLYAVRGLLIVILEIPTGALADLIGRKRTLIFGWIMSSIGYLMLPFAETKMVFLLVYLIPAIGEALNSGSDVALLYDSLKELKEENHFSKLMARYGLAVRSALILGAFFGGYLYTTYFGLPYFAIAIAHLLATVGFLFMTEPHIDSETFSLKTYIQQTQQGIKQLTRNLYSKALSVYYLFVGGITWAGITYFNLPFLYDSGLKEIQAGQAISFSHLLSAILLFLITHSFNLSKKSIFMIFPLLMIVGFIPGVFSNMWLAPLLVMIIQFIGSARFALLDSLVNEDIDSRYRATTISSLNMGVSIITIVLVGAGGYFQESLNTQALFSLLGMLAIVVILPITYFLLIRTKGRGEN